MSRRRHRLSQNAASLIRPSAVAKVCADCGRWAKACYTLQGERAGDYCQQHAVQRGFCTGCGNELTAAEHDRGHTHCDACLAKRYDPNDPDWDDHDDEYERPEL